MSAPAGIAPIALSGAFMFCTGLGSALWNLSCVVLGLILGATWPTGKR